MNGEMRVQNNSNVNAYGLNDRDDVTTTKARELSPAVLEVVKRFGLEDNEALRNELLESPPNRLNTLLLNSANDKLDGISQSMADVFTIMALMAKMAQENRQTARESREAERQVQYTELQNAADEIRQAADMALAAGIVSGFMKMASGAVSIGGGIKGLKEMGSATSSTSDISKAIDTPTTPATKPNAWVSAEPTAWKNTSSTPTTTPTATGKATGAAKTDAAPDATSTNRATDITVESVRLKGNMYQGASSIIAATGDLIAAGLTRMAEENRAEQKEAETAALKHETYAQNENDFMNSMDELIKDMRRMIQEISQLNNDSEKKAASV